MTIAEIALLITALSSAIVALLNARVNRHELDETQTNLKKSNERITELEKHRITDRRDIILIGESLAQARSDNSIMAQAFNALYDEYYSITGRKPSADLNVLKKLQTVE